MRRDENTCNTHIPEMPDLDIKFTKRSVQHQKAIGGECASFQTRLLTLVQVGDSREYATEAIIKWLLFIPCL
jgi:hypothetical protein